MKEIRQGHMLYLQSVKNPERIKEFCEKEEMS